MKVEVCIHHPLNPEMTKQCIGLRGHLSHWVTQLELPFSSDKKMFDQVLYEMTSEGSISHEDAGDLFKEASEKINQQEKLDKEALAKKLFATSTHPLLISSDVPPHRAESVNLNDPRISEINIKYRD